MKTPVCENCGGSGFSFGKRCACQAAESHPARKALQKQGNPSDTTRLDWALPLLTGARSEAADLRAAALAVALTAGLDDRAAIDAAMTYTNHLE